MCWDQIPQSYLTFQSCQLVTSGRLYCTIIWTFHWFSVGFYFYFNQPWNSIMPAVNQDLDFAFHRMSISVSGSKSGLCQWWISAVKLCCVSHPEVHHHLITLLHNSSSVLLAFCNQTYSKLSITTQPYFHTL